MTNNVIIPSVEKDRKEILQYLNNASDSLTRIEAERDQIKTIVEEVAEKFEINKKYIKKMISVHHKRNLAAVKTETDDLTQLYEAIVGE